MKLIGISNLCPSLLPAEKQVQMVRQEPMIMQMKKADAEKQIAIGVIKIVANILAIKSLKDISEKDEDFIIDYVSKTLLESFTTYRISEIQQACEMWAMGELFSDKDLNQLSAENIFKAIHRYGEKVKRESNHKQRQYEEKLSKELDERQRKEKLKTFEDVIIGKYQAFPETFKNESKGVLSAMYRHLDNKGLILLSVEAKKKIFNRILKIKDRTKWMKKPLLELTAKELAEYRALKIVFKDWKEMQINLREKLNENKPQ